MSGLPEIREVIRQLGIPPIQGGAGLYRLVLTVEIGDQDVDDDPSLPLRAELHRRLAEFVAEARALGPLIVRKEPTVTVERLLDRPALLVTAWARGLILPPDLTPEQEDEVRRNFAELMGTTTGTMQ